MLTLMKVAITGGLASGKTTVCSLFKELGAYVVSADLIVHHLLSPNTNLGKKIIDLLGSDIINNSQFNRKLIAKKVFSDHSLLLSYEHLIHPEVFNEINNEYQKALKGNYKLFVAEIPLLFEAKAERFFDCSVAVIANDDLRLERFNQRGNLSRNDFLKRDALQLSMQEKKERANFVIINDESHESLKVQVKYLFNQLVADKE